MSTTSCLALCFPQKKKLRLAQKYLRLVIINNIVLLELKLFMVSNKRKCYFKKGETSAIKTHLSASIRIAVVCGLATVCHRVRTGLGWTHSEVRRKRDGGSRDVEGPSGLRKWRPPETPLLTSDVSSDADEEKLEILYRKKMPKWDMQFTGPAPDMKQIRQPPQGATLQGQHLTE